MLDTPFDHVSRASALGQVEPSHNQSAAGEENQEQSSTPQRRSIGNCVYQPCTGSMVESVIQFGQFISDADMESAGRSAWKSDLAFVIGTHSA